LPALASIMDAPHGGITSLFTASADQMRQYDRRQLEDSMSKSSLTLTGTSMSVRVVLSSMSISFPADAPASGTLSARLLRTPTSADVEVSASPATFGVPTVAAEMMLQPMVAVEPRFSCSLLGPAAIFVELDSSGVMRGLGVSVAFLDMKSQQVIDRLAKSKVACRVSVERGVEFSGGS
jgi:hypothetical protein